MFGLRDIYRGNNNVGFANVKACRVANQDARSLVRNLTPFKGNNTAGVWRHGHYVVYSYGYHWPLFVCEYGSRQWYENASKYSISTSKHRSQLHPLCETVKLSLAEIRAKFSL